jgi:hypothetical protein
VVDARSLLLTGASTPGYGNLLLGSRPRSIDWRALQASGLTDEEVRLLRQAQTVERLSDRAAGLGIADVQGTGSRGFLAGALDYLTRPQSAVLGFATGALGLTQEGEETNPFLRALQGLSGAERFRGSDIVGPAGEDAGILERGLRAGAGLGIDIATDPLTYLTLGGGGVLRGAGKAVATEAEVAKAARAVLPVIPKVVPETQTALGTATQAAAEAAQQRSGAILGQPDTLLGPSIPTITRPTISAPEALAQAPGTVPAIGAVDDRFIERLATRAGEAQALRGSRGVRRSITEELSGSGAFAQDEAERLSREIFSQLRGEVRGGAGLRIPFVSTRFADLTPGGGILSDKVGMTRFAEQAREIYNTYRSGPMYAAFNRLMNGRFGEEYAAFIKNSVRDEGGMTYEAFRSLQKAGAAKTSLVAEKQQVLSSVLRHMEDKIAKSADPEEASRYASEYSQIRGRLPDLRAGASEAEATGYYVVETLREISDKLWDERRASALRAGLDMPEKPEDFFYIARVLTKEYRDWAKKKGRAYTTQYDPATGRRLPRDTDEFGKAMDASPQELNVRARLPKDQGGFGVPENINMYETDPVRVFAHQAASYTEDIADFNLLADLRASLSGMLVEPKLGTRALVKENVLGKRVVAAREELGRIVNRLVDASAVARANGDIKQMTRINEAITRLAADDTTIREVMVNIVGTDPREVDRVKTLVSVLKRAFVDAEKFGVKVSDKTKDRLLKKTNLITVRGVTLNADELGERGLERITSAGKVRVPEALTDAYAPPAIKAAIEKMYSVESGFQNASLRSAVDNAYMPYFTAFKTFATIGRPGGFQARNMVGAVWNNWLADVGAEDYKLAGIVLSGLSNSQARARRAVQNVLDGKASGLTGDEDLVAKLAAAARRRGSGSIEYEADQLADYLFRKEMAKIKVGDTTLDKINDAFVSQQLTRSSRRLEYMRDTAQRGDGVELVEAIRNPDYFNLFRGVSKEELNKIQQGMNAAINFKPLRMSADLTELQERYVRLAPFITGVRRYGLSDNGEAAGYLAKATQFDYQDLSQFERDIMKNIFPFYVWTRRNVPLQFSAIFFQPGKFNTLGYTRDELDTYFGAEGDDEGIVEVIPEWMRERMGFATRFQFRGQPILAGIESPAIDLNRFLAFGGVGAQFGRGGKELISASNPLTKAFVETITGYDLFTGGKIPEGTPSPFGELWFPGTFIGEDGKRQINAKAWGAAQDLVPTLGLISRVSGRGANADRQLTNILSAGAGLPVATGTVAQNVAELRAREDRLRKQINKVAISLGADKDWLNDQLDAGATADEIRALLAQGYGRRPELGE